jgi:hypothetical protein
MIMNVLPNELKLQIFYHLSYNDLGNVAQTNSEFREVCRDESIWRHLYERDFPNWGKYDETTWRESYRGLQGMYRSIYQFAQRYLEDHLMIEPDYARIDKMTNDLNHLIGNFVLDHSVFNTYTFVELRGLAFQMARIAIGFKEKYILDIYHRFNTAWEQLNDQTINELTPFLTQLELLNID